MHFDTPYLKKYNYLLGCDEVGRGPLAGPVVGCSTYLEKDSERLLNLFKKLGLTDSKKLTQKKRIEILTQLGIDYKNIQPFNVYTVNVADFKFSFCLWEHTPAEIDEMNILAASLSCMKLSSNRLVEKFQNGKNQQGFTLIDGNKTFDGLTANEAIVKGDSKSLMIGLASIIAKEYRDHLMEVLDEKYPGYGLKGHAGYPTKAHKEAIKKLGVTPIHRKTFKGVKEFC